MLRFFSIGSGSSGNCYYLFTETGGLLVDCGVSIRTLKKYFHSYGLSLSSIRYILITHDHADHVKSVGSLSEYVNVPVYSTEEIHAGIYRNWSVRRKVKTELKRFLSKGEVLHLDEFEVTPFAVPHDSADNVGYSIRYGGTVFTIVTDCGHVTEEIESFIGCSNYLVLEANYDPEMLRNGPYPQHLKERISGGNGHLSNVACGEALVRCATPSIHHVWLCHLSEENNHPELARKTVESILRSNGIVPGTDFMMDVLKRKVPSGIFELG